MTLRALLALLWSTPEDEDDPEAWATRAAAHFGLGAALALALVWPLGPAWASVVILSGYAAWEAAQWPGGRRMAWDGLLDWIAVSLGAAGVLAAWERSGPGAMAVAGLAALVLAIGIGRREMHRG